MTAQIVSLRCARKARARATAETTAAANRIAFGRTKAEKAAAADDAARRISLLDGVRRDTDDRS